MCISIVCFSLCFCFVLLRLSSLYQDMMQFESYAARARPPLLLASRIMALYLGAQSKCQYFNNHHHHHWQWKGTTINRSRLVASVNRLSISPSLLFQFNPLLVLKAKLFLMRCKMLLVKCSKVRDEV